jgi:hypothetical protein
MAGEFHLRNGEISYINNVSGTYQPGALAHAEARRIFENELHFPIRGRYDHLEFNEWVARSRRTNPNAQVPLAHFAAKTEAIAARVVQQDPTLRRVRDALENLYNSLVSMAPGDSGDYDFRALNQLEDYPLNTWGPQVLTVLRRDTASALLIKHLAPSSTSDPYLQHFYLALLRENPSLSYRPDFERNLKKYLGQMEEFLRNHGRSLWGPEGPPPGWETSPPSR